MSQTLDTLTSDVRLHDLFGETENFSATQLWLLEIRRESVKELRFLYGRVVPSTYKSDSWTSTSPRKSTLYDGCSVRVHALTLYTSADKLKLFLQNFIYGASLKEASQAADFELAESLSKNVGELVFGTAPYIRPVMHLPTRDYFQFKVAKRLSPSNFASADSCAIYPVEKARVFSVPESCDNKIAELACNSLNADTGMKFKDLDAWRIGDFELICMPALDRSERKLIEISLKGEHSSIKFLGPLTLEPTDLLIVLKSYSGNSVQTSYIAQIQKSLPYPLDHTFRIDDFQNQIATAYTLEIYAIGEAGEESILRLQTGNHFIRSTNINMQLQESISSTSRMEWLEKRISNRDKAKLESASRVARAIRPSHSKIGGHDDDPWIEENWAMEDNVSELLPKESAGHFFLTLSDSGGKSRLDLINWLRKIFENHHDAQIAWVDPFMEDVGINLLNMLGTATGDYLIITTEKESSEDKEVSIKKNNRIQRLLDSCSGWGDGYFGNVKLKVLTVPEAKIHDRMILIRAKDGKPLGGYHLSNSIQRANENFPLLATPIPLDVLPQVFEYTDSIIQKAYHVNSKVTPTAKLIFDSVNFTPNTTSSGSGSNNQASFANGPRAGDVFSWWLDDSELVGLFGAELIDAMKIKEYVNNGNLDSDLFEDMPSKFWSEGLSLIDFHSAWDATGYVLANSGAGRLFSEDILPLQDSLKQKLFDHLSPSRLNTLPTELKEKRRIDIEHYRNKSISELLLSHDDPNHVFRNSTVETSWSDYYAIKLLWAQAPNDLVSWLSEICSHRVDDHLRKYALVIQTFRHIWHTIGFENNLEKIEPLLRSGVDIVTWVGVHAFMGMLNRSSTNVDTLSKLDNIAPYNEQRIVLCWLINETNSNQLDIKPHLISKFIRSIESPLDDDQLQNILKPLRSRLGRLHNLSPWILESLLIPLLELKMINTKQVSSAWLSELTGQWRDITNNEHILFTLDADGAFSDELVMLITCLASKDKKEIIEELKKEFNHHARVIRKPMSAQINWSLYIRALRINCWIYALALRIEALMHREECESLECIIIDSEFLNIRLPASEYEHSPGKELLEYLKIGTDKIETSGLLAAIKIVTH